MVLGRGQKIPQIAYPWLLHPPPLWWMALACIEEPSTLLVIQVSFPGHHFAQHLLWFLLGALLDGKLALCPGG